MFKRFLALFIVLVFAGCVPGIVDAPTPTQETNYVTPVASWDIGCLPDGIVPINARPCPTNELAPLEFVSRPSVNYEAYNAEIGCKTHCVIGLHDPFLHAGFAGLQVHNVNLDAGQLYIINFNGVLNLQDAQAGDYAGAAYVHTDNGNAYPLREHSINQYVDGEWTRSGDRDFWWCIRAQEDVTVVVEAGMLAQWATYANGNNYEVEAFYIYPTNNINLCNEVVTVQ